MSPAAFLNTFAPPPSRFVKDLTETDMHRASLGLAHAYSRAKVKFNVKKVDNMIIQAIALMDTLDKVRGQTT